MQMLQQQMVAQQEASEARFAELLMRTTAPSPKEPTQYDQQKAFADLEKLMKKEEWRIWSWKLRSAGSQAYRAIDAILDWAQEKDDAPILDADVDAMVSEWPDIKKLNEQLHAILVKKFEKGTEGLVILHNTPGQQGLEAWRRLCRHYDPSNRSSRLNQLRALVKEQPTVGPDKVVLATENWMREMNKVVHRYDMHTEFTCECGKTSMVESTGLKAMIEDISIICITDVCPKLLKEHLKLNAVTYDTIEKVRNCMEKWVQSNVTERGSSPMDVDAIMQKKFSELENEINALRKGYPGKAGGKDGGKGGGKGIGKGAQDQQQKKCNCCGRPGHFWSDCPHKDKECGNCGGKGHLKAVCKKEGGGAHDPNKKPKGDGKGGGKNRDSRNRKGVNAVGEWPDDGEPVPEDDIGGLLVVGKSPQKAEHFSMSDKDALAEWWISDATRADWEDLEGAVAAVTDENYTMDETVRAIGSLRGQLKSQESVNAIQSQVEERINLTVHSGAVRSCLQEHVAPGVALRKVDKPAEYRAAGGEKLPELGTRTLKLKYMNGKVGAKEFSVCEGIRVNVLSTAEMEDDNCRIVHQPAKYGGSYVEKLTDKSKPLKPARDSRWQRIFRRGNKYQIPVWVVNQKSPNGSGPVRK